MPSWQKTPMRRFKYGPCHQKGDVTTPPSQLHHQFSATNISSVIFLLTIFNLHAKHVKKNQFFTDEM